MEDEALVGAQNGAVAAGDAGAGASVAHCAGCAAAGICNGLHADCSRCWQSAAAPGGEGVRSAAQLRLHRCLVDTERLKGAAPPGDAAASRGKDIRRLMRRMYGAPDQDYEDWQIVVLSDIDTGALLQSGLHCRAPASLYALAKMLRACEHGWLYTSVKSWSGTP